MSINKSASRGKPVDATQELIAIGAGSLVNCFAGAYPGNASFSKGAVNKESGARTPLGSLSSGILVILALLFLTPYFQYIPNSSLEAVIMAAVVFMVELHVIKPLWKSKRSDLIPEFACFITCLMLGIPVGTFIGIGVNMLFIIYHAARPKIQMERRSNHLPRYIDPVVLVHGGAGDIPDSRNNLKNRGTILAAQLGYTKLLTGGSALDAVEEAVRSMELDENFNAGYGSVSNLDGVASMEASIMSGDNLNGGCVTLVKDILHPISLARRVMYTNHTFLGGDGAMKFAKDQGIEILSPKGQLVTQHAKDALEAFKRDQAMGKSTINAKTEIGDQRIVENCVDVGTVGAVAIDKNGNIAVATSTGGMTGKMVGRIGDTPLLGSGTYADNNSGGVSTTGHGETIMRYNVAQKILQRIEYLREDAETATRMVLQEMTARLTGTAGAITIDASGNVGYYFTAKKMAWAYRKGDHVHYGIKPNDHFVETA